MKSDRRGNRTTTTTVLSRPAPAVEDSYPIGFTKSALESVIHMGESGVFLGWVFPKVRSDF